MTEHSKCRVKRSLLGLQDLLLRAWLLKLASYARRRACFDDDRATRGRQTTGQPSLLSPVGHDVAFLTRRAEA